MPRYTIRRAWPDDPKRPDDYVFRVDGKDAGRSYRMLATLDHGWVWLWTIYGTSNGGMQDTLEQAQQQFKAAPQQATWPRRAPPAPTR